MLPLLQSFQIHLASRRIVFHLFMLLFYVHGAPVAAISRLPLWVLGLVSLFSQFRPLLLVLSIVSSFLTWFLLLTASGSSFHVLATFTGP